MRLVVALILFVFGNYTLERVQSLCDPDKYIVAPENGPSLVINFDYSTTTAAQLFAKENMKFPPPRRVTEYCDDEKVGWSSNTDATWLVSKCYQNNPHMYCECECTCGSGFSCTSPACLSPFTTVDSTKCFQSTKPCQRAPIGNYTAGCGCQSLYLEKGRKCSPGHIIQCPKGYLCMGDYDLPVKCPNASYPQYIVDAGGKRGECVACKCPVGHYLMGYTTPEAMCTSTFAESQCVPCDPCTEGINADVRSIFNCVPRDYEKGRYSSGQCLKCETCRHPEYAYGNQTETFCITDKTVTQCEEQYFDSSQLSDYDNNQDSGSNLVSKGKMPWKSGLKRMMPKLLMATGSLLTGRRGNLPSYQKCPELPTGYTWIPNSNTDLKFKLTQLDWSYDCQMTYAVQCAKGYYAVLGTSSESSFKGFPGLLSCERCPSNSLLNDTGAFLTSCPCEYGYANKQELLRTFGGVRNVYVYQTAFDNSNAQCVNCYDGVAWVHSDSSFYREALVCRGNGLQADNMTCTGRTYLAKSGDTQCTECPRTAGGLPTVPTLHRTTCVLCPIGTFMNRIIMRNNQDKWECALCDASKDEFQDMPGQNACKRKRERCYAGKMIRKNDKTNIADHECVACKSQCDPGQITVRSPGTNNSDTCDGNGQSFFGCYDGTSDDSSPSFRPGTRLVYSYQSSAATSALRATVATCNVSLLPPNSEWISYHTPSLGVQCYFACIHAVDTNAAQTLQNTVVEYVRGNRKDMIPFLVSASVMNSALTLSNVIVEEKIVQRDTSLSWVAQDSYQVTSKNTLQASLNTFLFVDEILERNSSTWKNMCIAPKYAYPSSMCPTGFIQSTTENLRCAIQARTQLLSIRIGDNRVRHSVASSFGKELCAIDDFDRTKLARFRAGCTTNCLDSLQTDINNKLAPCHIARADYARLWYLKYYLSTTYWHQDSSNVPYIFTSNVNCSFRCKTNSVYSSVRVSIRDFDPLLRGCVSAEDFHTACIPCSPDHMKVICNLHSSPHFFIEGACSNLNSLQELTFSDVCRSCDSKPNATLVSSTDSAYNDWWSKRSSNQNFKGMDSGGNYIWEKVTCRYTCDVGYTSNNLSPDAYKTTPCLPCASADSSPQCLTYKRSRTPIYLSANQVCGAANNYEPFLPSCIPCSSETHVFEYLNATPTSLGQCLARCAPERFHTVRISENGNNSAYVSRFIDDFAPLMDTQCTPCSANPERPCNQTCSLGYFKASDSLCIPCNTSSCASPFEYREQCVPGSTRDASCVQCPEQALKNNIEDAVQRTSNKILTDSIWNTKGLYIRKWLGSDISSARVFSMFSNACPVECINNHVWINVTTGRHPFAESQKRLRLSPELVCLPCSSSYITQGLTSSSSNQILYSVWNATNTTNLLPSSIVGSTLHHMTTRATKGACYTCPDNTRDVLDSSTELCELRKGASVSQSTLTGLGTVTTTVGMARPVTTYSRPSISLCFGDDCRRRRRLLSTDMVSVEANTKIRKLVRVKKHPVVDIEDHFSCCEGLSRGNLIEFQNCKRERIAALESKKSMSDVRWGKDFCQTKTTTAFGRRLLNTDESLLQDDVNVTYLYNISNDAEQAVYVDDPNWCHTGTYKEERGNGPCLVCPAGTSTTYPYTGIENKHSCVCLPGFYAVRNLINGTLLYCSPCGRDRYRPSTSQSDLFCLDCPSNTYTPTSSSAYCYCKPGFFRSTFEGPCEPCEGPGGTSVNYFCSNDMKQSCPLHSLAPPLSSRRGDCICNSTTHYGSLDLPESQCISKPTGIQCNFEAARGVIGCSCAEGWINSGDGKCITPCIAGQFAVLAPNEKFIECRNCSFNSYSDNSQLITGGDIVCEPCPPNTFTLQEGSRSLEQCTCPSRGLNANNTLENGLRCGTCPPNTYLNVSVGLNTCMQCPEGTSSEVGSIGIQACLCSPGKRAVRSSSLFSLFSPTITCEPCPRGFFSSKMGSVCTACPQGYTTENAASTSIRDCSLRSLSLLNL